MGGGGTVQLFAELADFSYPCRGRGKPKLSHLFLSRIPASLAGICPFSCSEIECGNVNTFQNDFKIFSATVECLKKKKKKKKEGIPVMAQWFMNLTSNCRLLSGLRIWRCSELWCRSQMQLGSGIAVALG